MSVVWLAYDVKTQQQVALKIMTVNVADDKKNQKANERFLREIEISQSLKHAHILAVIDKGYMNYDGHEVPYLVTPFMKGGSLADVIEKTPPWESWTLVQTADAITQAAESIEYLHTRNPHIVHEDIKPGNFLVYSINKPERLYHLYLSDFGISRWLETNSMASDVLGTLTYMAPEQIERRVTPASDQYALALMACFMLTGKLPIQGATNDELMYAHLNEPPFLPSQLNPARIRSKAVDDIFLRALEKDPTRRFSTIAGFAYALQQAITDYTESESNAKTQFLDIATIPTSPLLDESQQRDALAAIEVDVFPIAIIPVNDGEPDMLDEPLPQKPQKRAVALPTPKTVLRSLQLHDVARYTLPARPKYFSWSHSGNALACVLYGHAPLFLTRDELLRGTKAQGGQVQLGQREQGIRPLLVQNATQATNLCWSPDNRVLAIATRNEVRFWDLVTNVELPLVLPANGRGIDGLAWSSRGQLAVWTETTISLYTLSDASLTQRQLPNPSSRLSTNGGRSGGTGGIGILHWSPDGSLLLAGTSSGSLFCWNVFQETLWQPLHAGHKISSVTWSANGTWFATAQSNKEVSIWDVRSKQRIALWENLPVMPRALDISIDGRVIFASSEHSLLSGFLNESAPSATLPGQLLVSWSPQDMELVTLDQFHENVLVLWQE